MDLADFLSDKGISLEQIVERANNTLCLQAGDVFLLCGSLVEGLGNEQSDIDLFLLTSRQNISFNSLNDVFFTVGPCLIDVRVKQWSAIEALLARFVEWSKGSHDPRGALGFSDDDRKLLHRLRSGFALYGEDDFKQVQSRLSVADLAWHRLEWARHFAGTLQVDLLGLHAARDPYSMVFAAQELLGHTIDGLLASHGYTNPGLKWRARQLMELPGNWEYSLPGRLTGLSALNRYLALHRAPENISPRTALHHALRIVAFSRCVFPWIEWRRIDPMGSSLVIPAFSGTSDREERLPHLDLNVAVLCHVNRLELVRLNGDQPAIQISPQAWLLLCLFDGETRRADAIDYANRLSANESGEVLLDDLIALTRFANLEVRETIDEELLNKILGVAPQVGS